MSRVSYVPHRRLLYGLLWLTSVAVLGLTAFRIHFTRSLFHTHERIIAELLTVSILTILWVPATLIFHRNASSAVDAGATRRSGGLGFLHGETFGNLLIWIMWFVGAAIATHSWPTRGLAGPGKQGRILITIVALSWIAFSLLTLAKIFASMEYAARNAVGHGAGPATGHATNGYGTDKTAPGTTTAAGGATRV